MSGGVFCLGSDAQNETVTRVGESLLVPSKMTTQSIYSLDQGNLGAWLPVGRFCYQNWEIDLFKIVLFFLNLKLTNFILYKQYRVYKNGKECCSTVFFGSLKSSKFCLFGFSEFAYKEFNININTFNKASNRQIRSHGWFV